MVCEKIFLKEHFEFLAEGGRDPYIQTYLPDNMITMKRENYKRPCLVVCPGGGYEHCSEREAEPIALRFLECGYNVFVISYSVAPNVFPTQLREVAATLELIYKNADSWNCDTEKIAIIGFSAGGHLAAHYSTSYDCNEIREVFPESKPVNAAVLSYPVISIALEKTHKRSFINLLGYEPTHKEEIEKFSLEYQVSSNTPPTFIWHTAEDGTVPVKNSLVYAEALDKYKIPFEMHIYPFGEHGLATCDGDTINNPNETHKYVSSWIEDVKKWLKLILSL